MKKLMVGAGVLSVFALLSISTWFLDRTAHHHSDKHTNSERKVIQNQPLYAFHFEKSQALQQEEHSYVWHDALIKKGETPQVRKGVQGDSILFDGYSTYLEIPYEETKQPTDSFTVSAWVAPRAYEWGDEGYTSAIINQHNEKEKEGYVLGVGRHGYPTFQVGISGQWIELWAPKHQTVNKGEWTHLTAVFNKEQQQIELYRNGELVQERTVPEGGTYTPSSDDPLRIGKHNQAVAVSDVFQAHHFNGLLDEVKVENRALAEEEVKQMVEEKEGDLASPNLSFNRHVYSGDPYRPNYHFTAPRAWMNEPHAPIYANGKYHLFYQFNPFGPFWHQIHWGHAVSDNMLNWEDASIALSPSEDTAARDGVWSGSATKDEHGVPVLYYTAGHDEMTPNQMTGLARPTNPDDPILNNWTMKPEPVTVQEEGLTTEEGKVRYGEFRDPFVWKEGEKWYQLVGSGVEGAGGTALVYSSNDMESWSYEGPLMIGDEEKYPKTGDVWEMPALLPVQNERTGEEKMMFVISPYFSSASPYASRYTFYWIGEWDQETASFQPDHEAPKSLDYGEHMTGVQGFVDEKGRTLLTSILQDRRGEKAKYESGWAHGAGMPMEVYLTEDNELGRRPVQEVEDAQREQLLNIENVPMKEANRKLDAVHGDTLQIQLTLDVSGTKHAGLKVFKAPDVKEETFILYNNETSELLVDRGRSSLNPSIEKGVQGGHLDLEQNELTLNVLMDRSILEIYANEEASISTRVFPTLQQSDGVQIYGIDGAPFVKSLKVWNMGTTIDGEED